MFRDVYYFLLNFNIIYLKFFVIYFISFAISTITVNCQIMPSPENNVNFQNSGLKS